MIHPSADISDQATIGSGTYIWHFSQIRENVRIGQNCILGKDVYVDFGVQIGDNVKIQNGAYIYHGTQIESGVFVGPGVIFTNDRQPRAINPNGTLKENNDWEVGPIRVCTGASIGAGAIILPNVVIGKFAMVGAGAIVTRDVKEYSLVVGNPARPIGYVCRCGARMVKVTDSLYYCLQCDIQYRFQKEYENNPDFETEYYRS